MNDILFSAGIAAANIAVVAWLAPVFATRYGNRTPSRALLIAVMAPFVAVGFLDPSAVPALTLGAAAALLDARCRRLPLELTALLLAEWTLLAFTAPVDWPKAFVGCIIWVAPLALGALMRQVGWGDVLFAIPLGLWSGSAGLQPSLGGLGIALVGSGIWSLAVRGRRGRRVPSERVPFGPFLWAGAVIAWLLALA